MAIRHLILALLCWAAFGQPAGAAASPGATRAFVGRGPAGGAASASHRPLLPTLVGRTDRNALSGLTGPALDPDFPPRSLRLDAPHAATAVDRLLAGAAPMRQDGAPASPRAPPPSL